MSDTATEHERETLANLIPLGFTERDPVRDVYEAADRILAAGFRLRGCCSPPGDTTQCLDSPEQETEA